MIPVASEVRNAIRAGASQRALLYFVEQGMYFTVNDIVLGSLRYTGSFNPDTELTMGKTVSAQLEYSLINEDGALNGFTFGDFNAYMGVKMGQFPYMVGTANVVLDFQGNRYAGYSTVPYLTKNGEAYPTQPSAPVEALIALDDTLYCISSNRTVMAIRQTNATHWEDLENRTWLSQEAYTWDSYEGSYSVWTTTITDELTWAICKRYIEKGAGVSLTDNSTSLIFKDGVAEEYQYTQIGHFYAERPARVRTNAVAVTAYDAMFARLNELAVGLTTPTTVQGLFDQVVTRTGVTSKATGILNGSMPVPSIDFSDMTYREVLGLIAQAACSYALFDYDGRLDLRWFTQTGISIDEHNYKECIPYEYTVKTIDKFQARTTESDVGIVVGSGTNGYVLQNHPFFVFDSDAAGRPYCQNIYNRLNSLGEYTPMNVSWFVDFAMQPGDIITVGYKGETYTFPIFMQNYTWTGISSGTSDCTGSEYREVLSAANRRVWREQSSQVKRYTEITSSIDGLTIKTGVDRLSTGETLYSKITSVADSVTLTFEKIGASGYTARGITTINENGIKVTHSSVANCYTQMSANGFQIKNSSGTVLGGLMSLNGQVVTAMNALYNPTYPNFKTDVGLYTPQDKEGTTSGQGLSLKYDGVEFLHIGRNIYSPGYAQTNELFSSQSLWIAVKGGFSIQRIGGGVIYFSPSGDIEFSYKNGQGVIETKRISELAVSPG